MGNYDECELAEAVATKLAEAVAAGAEFMDAIDANITDDSERWFWVVNPETLDMSGRRCGCVLMQHSPSGYFLPREYGIVGTAALGMHAGYDGPNALAVNAKYEALTALWREAIYDRRSAWFDAHPEAIIAEAAAS